MKPEKIKAESPLIIWIHEGFRTSVESAMTPTGDDLSLTNKTVYQAVMAELRQYNFLQTNIRTIASALDLTEDRVLLDLSIMYEKGFFKQVTIYQEGKSYVNLFDPSDKHPRFTPTELKAFQKAQPKWSEDQT